MVEVIILRMPSVIMTVKRGITIKPPPMTTKRVRQQIQNKNSTPKMNKINMHHLPQLPSLIHLWMLITVVMVEVM